MSVAEESPRELKVVFVNEHSWTVPAVEIRSDHKHGYLTYRNATSGDRVTINLDHLQWFKIGDPQ